MGVLECLEPNKVFKYFEEISCIPHGSGNTDKISSYLADFAKARKLDYIRDGKGNVIIFKAGTQGYENSAPVIIQGHMDMVCEKTADSDINLAEDGLKLRTDGEKVWAEGTTLGGDDGIAVAIALAILASEDLEHPPLEAVFTVDEETGMLGASYMDCSMLKGRTMLNLDSEDEGVLLVSCAGGATACCTLNLQCELKEAAKGSSVMKLYVYGGTGGHSGVEIDKQRANASKVLGRVLFEIKKIKNIHLMEVSGGTKDNAIPREACALLYIENEAALSELTGLTARLHEIIGNEYIRTDSNIGIRLETVNNGNVCVLTKQSRDLLINTLQALPNGIIRMSNDIEGMVQTSLNLGIMNTELISDTVKRVSFSFCVRSSVDSEKKMLLDELDSIMELAGGSLTVTGEYPAWEYRKDSRLRELMTARFEALFGRTPKVEAIHAGVECGLFADKLEGLDCVSYGPDIADIHTTSETLYVDSVRRTYEYTLDILKNLK